LTETLRQLKTTFPMNMSMWCMSMWYMCDMICHVCDTSRWYLCDTYVTHPCDICDIYDIIQWCVNLSFTSNSNSRWLSCAMTTHSYVCHDSCISVPWLIHVCAMTHAYIWYDSFMCVTWHRDMWREWVTTWRELIRMCAMTRSHVCHDSFTCVPWLIHMCAMTDELQKSQLREAQHKQQAHLWEAFTSCASGAPDKAEHLWEAFTRCPW